MSDSVLFSLRPASASYQIGVITLNKAKKLNSLDPTMVAVIHDQLKQWQSDDRIACVWLEGVTDRAFCAGGDVKAVYEAVVEGGVEYAADAAQRFFEHEYRLDFFIHSYSKPIVVWGSGIVMGGGVGLMAGASHRIVTDTSRLAMPEITIGLFPDVGASWFLNRMPENAGLFLGLTGAQFGAADALSLGLADVAIPHECREKVLEQLTVQFWSDDQQENQQRITSVLKGFEKSELAQGGQWLVHRELINELMNKNSLIEIVAAFHDHVTEDSWLQKARETLQSGSPTTACLVYEQLRRGKGLSLAQVFQMELVLAIQCVLHPDFSEGVRALLVDKDGNPNWYYSSVEAVPERWVQAHFEPPWPDGVNPLQNLPD